MAAGGHAVKCYLESHLAHKDGGEDVVGDGEEDSFLETQSERGEDERSNEIRQNWLGRTGATGRVYQAALQDLGPLQSHGDAVGEDEGQHHVVEQLVGDDGLAQLSEPGRRRRV